MGKLRPNGPYERLKGEEVVATLDLLCKRVEERFGERGLTKLAEAVRDTGAATVKAAQRLRRPFILPKLLAAAVIAGGIAAQVWLTKTLDFSVMDTNAATFVQVLDAGVNVLLVAGGAVWFLYTLEVRIKREQALTRLHELRSLVHIIDMHQLKKDPTKMLSVDYSPTASSPEKPWTIFALTRYLSYCSEMMALVGKLAALYGEATADQVVIEAISDLERLTTDLVSKIWQKITLLEQLDEQRHVA